MATPKQYLSAFELFADGQAVLDDLTAIFGGPPFVKGEPDTTAFNCGAKAVIEHIHARIEQGRIGNNAGA